MKDEIAERTSHLDRNGQYVTRIMNVFLLTVSVLAAAGATAMAKPVPPIEGDGTVREVSVDCTKETQKQVELKPTERSVQFVFDHCMCDTKENFWVGGPRSLKAIVKDLIDYYVDIANGGTGGGGLSGNVPRFSKRDEIVQAFRHRETLEVKLGETQSRTIYCYPRSIIDKIHEWGASITGGSKQ